MRKRCAVLRTPGPQCSRGRLWAVLELEFRFAGKTCQASTLRSNIYFRLGELLRTGKEKEFRSDNQEQEDINGTGEVEH